MAELNDAQLSLLILLVNDRIIEADKLDVPDTHPSSVFRQELMDTLCKMRALLRQRATQRDVDSE